MSAPYKGATVPVATDTADGPKAFRDFTDSFATIDALEAASVPIGTVLFTCRTTAEVGYLLLDGATVAGAQTLYPLLWAIVPTSWHSGVNLVLPDARGRFPVVVNPANAALDTVGEQGGAFTKTITGGNLPPHTHTQQGTFGSGGASARHFHGSAAGGQFVETFFGTALGVPAGGTGARGGDWTGNDITDHAHNTTISGETGNGPGSSAALDITPPFIAFNLMIRAA